MRRTRRWHSKGGALQAVAVVDRVRRALGELSDAMTAALQTTAEDVGGQLNEVEDWQVALFSEEVSDPPPPIPIPLPLLVYLPPLAVAAGLGLVEQHGNTSFVFPNTGLTARSNYSTPALTSSRPCAYYPGALGHRAN